MSAKKRKVDEEGRVVQAKWRNLYFFVEGNGKPVCLICGKEVSVCKSYNVRRHYDTKHAVEYDEYIGQLREDKVAKLEQAFRERQRPLLPQPVSDCVVKAGYMIAHKIAKLSRPFSEGNFIKECLLLGIEAICPEISQAVAYINLSENTVTESVSDIAENLNCQLEDKVKSFVAFSVAFHEITDVNNVEQLAIFIRGVDDSAHITQEFVELVPVKETASYDDVFNSVVAALDKLGVNWSHAVSLAMDGARKAGVVTKFKEKLLSENPEQEFYHFHGILHQDMLYSQALKMDHVIDVVLETVTYIRTHGHNHRQFNCFLEESESPEGMSYQVDVRWVSEGAVLIHFYDLRDEIQAFLDRKGKVVLELHDSEWLQDLAFLVDITEHMSNLNTKMKVQQKLVTDYYDCICGFEIKLQLWERQLSENIMTHFPTLKFLLENAESPCDAQTGKYAIKISRLRDKLQAKLSDYKTLEQDFALFQNPFSTRVLDVPDDLQLEIIALQCDSELKAKYAGVDVGTFYQHVGPRYPRFKRFASKILSMFGNTFVCERFLSVINKSRFHGGATYTQLNSVLKVVTAQTLAPDFDKLVEMKRLRSES